MMRPVIGRPGCHIRSTCIKLAGCPAGLTGEHRVQAHELPYAEQAGSGPQHRLNADAMSALLSAQVTSSGLVAR